MNALQQIHIKTKEECINKKSDTETKRWNLYNYHFKVFIIL